MPHEEEILLQQQDDETEAYYRALMGTPQAWVNLIDSEGLTVINNRAYKCADSIAVKGEC